MTCMNKEISEYYKKRITIATCDKLGNITGEIERWEAHEKGILHRAFTVALLYKNKIIIQHRKHPVFNGVFDVTSSSHQTYSKGIFQNTIEATYKTLEREWNLNEKDLLEKPKDLGTVYYKAKDKFSIYWEHEVCNIVTVKVKKLPEIVEEVAYGMSLVDAKDLKDTNSRLYQNLAPWVKVMIEKKFL